MSRRKKVRKGERGAWLPLKVQAQPEVINLSHAAFRVLVLLAAQYNGRNNGALGLSKSQAGRQNVSNKTLYMALRRLEEIDVIRQTYPASRVPPRPTMYALTWRAVDDTDWSRATRMPARLFRTT